MEIHQGTTQADETVLFYSRGMWIYAFGEAEKNPLRGISLLEYKMCASQHTHIWGQLMYMCRKRKDRRLTTRLP